MVLLTVARTLFYQFFLVFVGISVGFIVNSEWVGYKSALVSKSVANIFFPLEFTPQMEANLRALGAQRVWAENGSPADFQVLGDVVYANDEFYWCRFAYRDSNGELKFDEDTVRMRWKTWEYGFHNPTVLDPIDTKEEVDAEVARLEAWQKKIREAIRKADEKQKELLEQEKTKKVKPKKTNPATVA